MELYLRDARPQGRWVRDLLMALAWSQGDGLDDPQAVGGDRDDAGNGTSTPTTMSCGSLDSPAADLLHRTDHRDRAAYRLFHEALGEHLRQYSSRYRPPAETQRRLAAALIAHVPRARDGVPDWSCADDYTRTYLPVHAARGTRILDTLLDDAGFLATAEPAPATRGSPGGYH